MCCTTATKPITKTAQKYKKNTPIQVTKENIRKRVYKKFTFKNNMNYIVITL
jgi:hypothetical protein